MKVAVLGAGLIGVATAWWLRQAGYEVCLIDRRPQVAQGCSRHTGGLISVGQARPWAQPSTPRLLLRGLFDERAPMRFRPGLDPAQWLWGLRFLRQCTPKMTRDNTLNLLRLSEYSRNLIEQMGYRIIIIYHTRLTYFLTTYM